ncbi:minor capsid protein [Pararhizobium qamdonense]|uniref:minor capsid protein n=1 Tax=Pararhizobium qamdonense TaxID=3031126 RepID=UPI0023E0B60F|nr:minor capsid protein [Pararhizobium qamdonense]
MIWDIIVKKIEDAGLGEEGVTLFRSTIPADKTVAIGLFEPLDGIRVDPHLPHFYKPNLKVIVRHNKISVGRKLANAVMGLLTVTGEEVYEANDERGAVHLKVFYPKSLPIQFPAASGNATEWSLNFQTAFTLKPV